MTRESSALDTNNFKCLNILLGQGNLYWLSIKDNEEKTDCYHKFHTFVSCAFEFVYRRFSRFLNGVYEELFIEITEQLFKNS